MSEFHVRVVRVGDIEKHPNADTLSITKVDDYPVIIRTGDFKPGDLAVYVPIDSVIPKDSVTFAFLGDMRRIKAKKLRGIFSMGLLVPPPADLPPERLEVGTNVQAEFGIEKYDPEVGFAGAVLGGDNEKDPGFLPVYTDIEGLRRYPNVLAQGEEVVLTEKTHGCNSRFVFRDGRLWIGSHKRIKKADGSTVWHEAASRYALAEKLAAHPNIAIYGEVYGQVQDLKYGVQDGVRLALFDAMDTLTRRYFDFDEFVAFAGVLGLPTVPILYRGPWSNDLRAMAEGKSTMADHVREGFVVRPVKERHEHMGRVVLKMVGEGYLLRKGA